MCHANLTGHHVSGVGIPSQNPVATTVSRTKTVMTKEELGNAWNNGVTTANDTPNLFRGRHMKPENS